MLVLSMDVALLCVIKLSDGLCLCQMLDENNQFIQAIIDYQNKGKAQEVIQ